MVKTFLPLTSSSRHWKAIYFFQTKCYSPRHLDIERLELFVQRKSGARHCIFVILIFSLLRSKSPVATKAKERKMPPKKLFYLVKSKNLKFALSCEAEK